MRAGSCWSSECLGAPDAPEISLVRWARISPCPRDGEQWRWLEPSKMKGRARGQRGQRERSAFERTFLLQRERWPLRSSQSGRRNNLAPGDVVDERA